MSKTIYLFFIVLTLYGCASMAQKNVEGVVKDSAGVPLPSVEVYLKGTGKVMKTDAKGNFAIQVPDEKSVLIFYTDGKVPQEIVVGEKKKMSVSLSDAHSPDAPFAEAAMSMAVENYARVKVFYATDRKMTASDLPSEKFGTKRSGDMHYGSCEVSIPRNHKMGQLEEASVWRFEWRDDPEKHVVLLGLEVDGKDDFFRNLKERVLRAKEKKAFVFIHGYNVSFEDAARRTAQMAYDLAFDGAPVFYSWPSVGKTLAYNIDEGNIEWSQSNLKAFLEDFLKKSDAQSIYLIAHSMGNRGLTRALGSIISEHPEEVSRIKEIILAAPDIDADVFKRDIAPALVRCDKPITLYVSSKDKALLASQTFSSYPRAGQAGTSMPILAGIETIDASNVDSDLLGHSYFSSTPGVLADIFGIIAYNQRAGKRFGLRPVERAGSYYWEFKPN